MTAWSSGLRRSLKPLPGLFPAHPSGYAFYLCALDFALGEPLEIVVAGQRGAADTKALLQVLRDVYLPGASVLFKPSGEDGAEGAG